MSPRRGSTGEPAPATVAKPPANQPMTPEGISAMSSKLDLLMCLGDARTAGVLTDEEFTSKKSQLPDLLSRDKSIGGSRRG